MIINESSNKNDYKEMRITNTQKFISAIGGLMDNSLKESSKDLMSYEELRKQRRELNAKQVADMLRSNKMSNPPTVQEIKQRGNKIKVPWFLVGTLLSKAHSYGLEKDKDK